MNKVKEFMNGLSKVNESHVLSIEEQEMVDGGACEGASCKSGCLETKRKKQKSISTFRLMRMPIFSNLKSNHLSPLALNMRAKGYINL